ncbi:hypothetical protein llap_6432 [Limosa lapponica baueri]|uniref:Uncharacterized protein n=1 Tax=Limosa lapponica baueri TaxID=1758121 RepID=A0A2I0UB63_LIMLA|nr:hypothetical protein llap_6432 [Limosa lapponica baueri]
MTTVKGLTLEGGTEMEYNLRNIGINHKKLMLSHQSKWCKIQTFSVLVPVTEVRDPNVLGIRDGGNMRNHKETMRRV